MNEEELNIVERAIAIASQEHEGQVDKSGMPYILHPLRVMLSVTEYGAKTMATAVLHDVVEDCDVELSDLAIDTPFDEEIIEAIDALTKRKGEKYRIYLARVKENPMAVAVKQADIKDNTLPERLKKLPLVEQHYLLNKYAEALTLL